MKNWLIITTGILICFVGLFLIGLALQETSNAFQNPQQIEIKCYDRDYNEIIGQKCIGYDTSSQEIFGLGIGVGMGLLAIGMVAINYGTKYKERKW